MEAEARERVVERLAAALAGRTEVRFAVLFGSFHTEDVFHDVDIGVWADAAAPAHLDVDLAVALSGHVGLPVDVRLLNNAPVPFLFHALRGRVLSARDEHLLADVMERTARDYHDRAPLLRRAALEAFAG